MIEVIEQGYRWEGSHGVVRCWIVPFSRDLARLRQRRGTRPEHPVVAAAEDGFGYRDRGDRRAVEVAVGQVAVTGEDQRQMVDISPENERFIQQQIEAGVFRTRTDALDSGVELLRRRTELLERIDWGRRHLDQGDYREYDDGSLQQRFEQLKHRAQGGMRVQEER